MRPLGVAPREVGGDLAVDIRETDDLRQDQSAPFYRLPLVKSIVDPLEVIRQVACAELACLDLLLGFLKCCDGGISTLQPALQLPDLRRVGVLAWCAIHAVPAVPTVSPRCAVLAWCAGEGDPHE